ncbi:hypothetical protein [Sulfuricurvum sp.]|uniref:hypothetical protein n=1 Tax=Sulfuricurvum sp. TaxID=2025608 RepID=UPI002613AF44|nr:hypothetical protein [Sulfuricurvum sp.]MDD2265775.1 hypothetical protein [Sulfuricurvum sp.]MDD2783102.1 hypothetical protein [Sulfuricurvum sp.]
MGRYKVTDAILEEIETYAEDQYSIDDMFDELNLSKKLRQDERVIQAFERGLIKLFILSASSDMSDEEIMNEFDITAEQCKTWHEQFNTEIQQAKDKAEEDKKHATKQFSSPLFSGMVNILYQYGEGATPISQKVLRDDIKEMVKKMQKGDTTHLLTMLTTNILQLQLFNGMVTRNITGEAGKKIDGFEVLTGLQLKVMQETRKSIMAINEITNPKRTTFIKEVAQHNHLHSNSEKKEENENELQKAITHTETATDAEVLSVKEKVL